MPPFQRLPPTSAPSWQGAAPPSCPARAQPITETHSPTAPPVPAAQQQNLLPSQDGRKAAWVPKCDHRPSSSSVRVSRPPCHTAGLAEGLLLTADTFGLTVNNKTKSLCTALQTLLHPPGYTAELHDRVGDLCSTLRTESLLATSAFLQQQTPVAMERKEIFLQEKQNHATVKTEVTWFCAGNAACPPHTLRQACEEQGRLGTTATPGSPLQTAATNVQMALSGEHPRKQPARTSTGPGPALLHRMASCPAAARNRSKYNLCLHDVMCQEAAPLGAAKASGESESRMLKKCVHVSGEQDICPTVRHSDWSNAKPMHEWTHSRLKPTKIQTVKKCPECILRGSAKPLLWVARPLPSPAQKDVLQDDLREHCYQPSAQRAEMGPDLLSEMGKHLLTACLQGLCTSQPAIFKQ